MFGQIFSDIEIIGLIIGLFLSAFGLILNAIALFKSSTSTKVNNYHELIKSHREIWKMTIDDPKKYERILLKEVDLEKNPTTYEEKRFIDLVLLHMTSAYYFSSNSKMIDIEKLKFDFDDFLSHPLPKKVWFETKHFYNKDFRIFVDN